ncbi:MAG: signal peptidase II [Armatimonadetes bacterium]|nr:signal peptidase II [Armatimonadota bacterium]
MAFLIFLGDQATKAALLQYLTWGASVPCIGSFLYLTLVANRGGAFGMFQAGGAVLLALSMVAVILLTLFHTRIARKDPWVIFCLGLVTGGALGNLSDRIRYGYVVDFLDLRWWPVFNVADAAITVGVTIMIIRLLFRKEESRKERDLHVPDNV